MECGIPTDGQLKDRAVVGSLRCEPGVLPFIRHGENIIDVHVFPFLPVSCAQLGMSKLTLFLFHFRSGGGGGCPGSPSIHSFWIYW
jgi:hypothetical protein